jgi:hypothetical protein
MSAQLLLLLALAGLQSLASAPMPTPAASRAPGYGAGAFEPIDADIIGSEGYLAAHPDQRFRVLAIEARRAGHLAQAQEYFRQAARYADKASQGALAEMYWNGEGSARNRALAYAWMDLAAERGAPLLLAHRERYWSQMTNVERDEAVRAGAAIFAEYGDAVAKPRLERKLVSARRKVTGSRVGWIGHLSICIEPSLGSCGTTVTGEQYYADRYWKPGKYWEWQDRILLTPERTGEVEVGPVQPMRPRGSGEEPRK